MKKTRVCSSFVVGRYIFCSQENFFIYFTQDVVKCTLICVVKDVWPYDSFMKEFSYSLISLLLLLVFDTLSMEMKLSQLSADHSENRSRAFSW